MVQYISLKTILIFNHTIAKNYINIINKKSFFDDQFYDKTLQALWDLITLTVFDHIILKE